MKIAGRKRYCSVRCRILAGIEVTENACWVWLRGLNRDNGYACLRVDGRMWLGHILSYREFCGEIPSGFVVRHRCHNPACVNPSHLIIGSSLENAEDSGRAGRHTTMKLTREQAREIKIDGRPRKQIAKSYGVTYGQVWNIQRGISWKEI